MESWWTYICCGGVFFAPVVTFIIGFKIGREGLPWRVRIEPNESYAVKEG